MFITFLHPSQVTVHIILNIKLSPIEVLRNDWVFQVLICQDKDQYIAGDKSHMDLILVLPLRFHSQEGSMREIRD